MIWGRLEQQRWAVLLVLELSYRYWMLTLLTPQQQLLELSSLKMNGTLFLLTVTNVNSSQWPESLRVLAQWQLPGPL